MLKDLKSSVWFALGSEVACERQTFSLAHRRWGTFREEEPQRQKFHTDDVNHCLRNKSGSHGVPNANLFNFTFLLLDFGKTLCSSANELQQNSNAIPREYYIPQILTVLLEIHRIYIWPLPPFVCHLWTIAKTIELLCWPISASDRILDRCDVFSMEFLSLSCRRSSSQNFPNGQERGEMAAFAC